MTEHQITYATLAQALVYAAIKDAYDMGVPAHVIRQAMSDLLKAKDVGSENWHAIADAGRSMRPRYKETT